MAVSRMPKTVPLARRECFDYDRMMREGPDIAHIANLVGDPARANMLTALVGGTALTASELALEAGVTLQTASSHLSKLTAGGLLKVSVQGRHRYFALAGPHIAAMLEAIMGVAAVAGPQRVRPGPRDKAMREARVCYDHLAGSLAVSMLDRLLAEEAIVEGAEGMWLGRNAQAFFAERGIDVAELSGRRRPICRACLDWSVRRSHLAGSLGAAILDKVFKEKWARRQRGGRTVTFSPNGRQAFAKLFLAEAIPERREGSGRSLATAT
jgi:DNA-binding transcriptional ArsR family regulator